MLSPTAQQTVRTHGLSKSETAETNTARFPSSSLTTPETPLLPASSTAPSGCHRTVEHRFVSSCRHFYRRGRQRLLPRGKPFSSPRPAVNTFSDKQFDICAYGRTTTRCGVTTALLAPRRSVKHGSASRQPPAAEKQWEAPSGQLESQSDSADWPAVAQAHACRR